MVTIEQIDEFRKRTNSSYEDARFFLERHQGDVLEAIIDFEKTKASWRPPERKQNKGEFGRKVAELLQKGFDLRMTVEDKAGKLLFTVPILLMLILMPAWPMMLFACLFLILLGYRLNFRDIKSTAVDVKDIFENLGSQMRDVSKTQHAHHPIGFVRPEDAKKQSQAAQPPVMNASAARPAAHTPTAPVHTSRDAGQVMTYPPTEPVATVQRQAAPVSPANIAPPANFVSPAPPAPPVPSVSPVAPAIPHAPLQNWMTPSGPKEQQRLQSESFPPADLRTTEPGSGAEVNQKEWDDGFSEFTVE